MKTKICVPIVAQVSFSILAMAEELSSLPIDAVEWRVDYFVGNQDEIPGIIMRLKDVLNEKKLIVTLRTVEEGGEENGARFDYFSVIRGVIDQGMAEYVDIELDRDEESLKSMIALSGSSDTKIIGSYHDFESMPDEDFIYDKLTYARDIGCD
ncbi:MAG: type I 3-dehydroquinate dehydratase, partial [Eubacterium sp.]|nr:type I 3-dehydroquinate dehydratase [Eubacterium sp.]